MTFFVILIRYYKDVKDMLHIQKRDLWLMNGGGATFYHFLELPEAEQRELLEYLETLLASMEVEVNGTKFHLIHGFPTDTLEKQVWTRPTLRTRKI